ncbi:MAG TPA: hypothetical protein VJT82_11180 [Pyrinomonadaceae bacterium]|nr:hypothetical protein [Pyrinomonadaceae bacterium]
MNNYLSNLVAKAFNHAPVVKPLSAPLFAPTPYVAGAFGKPDATSFGRERAPEEENESLDAQHEPNPAEMSRHRARNVGAEDQSRVERTLSPHRQAHERGLATRTDESHASDFAEATPVFAPPPTRRESAETSSVTRPTPRKRNAQADTDASREASPTRAASEEPRTGVRPETMRPDASVGAFDAQASQRVEAALTGLRERLDRDEAEARQLEDELDNARAGVRRLKADASARGNLSVQTSDAAEAGSRAVRQRKDRRGESSSEQSPSHATPQRITPAPRFRPATPAPSSRRNSDADAASNAPAPTIQVTIGRIEVRAAPTPAPARRTSAQTPHLSLEEYLRRRNGGGR